MTIQIKLGGDEPRYANQPEFESALAAVVRLTNEILVYLLLAGVSFALSCFLVPAYSDWIGLGLVAGYTALEIRAIRPRRRAKKAWDALRKEMEEDVVRLVEEYEKEHAEELKVDPRASDFLAALKKAYPSKSSDK